MCTCVTCWSNLRRHERTERAQQRPHHNAARSDHAAKGQHQQEREEKLARLAGIRGVYVPSFYDERTDRSKIQSDVRFGIDERFAAENIVIATHSPMDGDGAGSGLALMRALTAAGKYDQALELLGIAERAVHEDDQRQGRVVDPPAARSEDGLSVDGEIHVAV